MWNLLFMYILALVWIQCCAGTQLESMWETRSTVVQFGIRSLFFFFWEESIRSLCLNVEPKKNIKNSLIVLDRKIRLTCNVRIVWTESFRQMWVAAFIRGKYNIKKKKKNQIHKDNLTMRRSAIRYNFNSQYWWSITLILTVLPHRHSLYYKSIPKVWNII